MNDQVNRSRDRVVHLGLKLIIEIQIISPFHVHHPCHPHFRPPRHIVLLVASRLARRLLISLIVAFSSSPCRLAHRHLLVLYRCLRSLPLAGTLTLITHVSFCSVRVSGEEGS